MTEFGKKHQKLKNIYSVSQNTQDVLNESHSWQAIAKNVEEFQNSKPDDKIADDIVYVGKVLQGGNFSGENLQNSDFSGSNMQEVNLTNAKQTERGV